MTEQISDFVNFAENETFDTYSQKSSPQEEPQEIQERKPTIQETKRTVTAIPLEILDHIKGFDDFHDEETDESDECGVKYLLDKNTPSFRCLVQVAVSNSSLLRAKLYHFPPLEDPGIDEAFFQQGKSQNCLNRK